MGERDARQDRAYVTGVDIVVDGGMKVWRSAGRRRQNKDWLGANSLSSSTLPKPRRILPCWLAPTPQTSASMDTAAGTVRFPCVG